jgi:HSP90 family molecular chaperone
MSAAAAQQTFEFQAEMNQLLDIVVHSRYTEKRSACES